MKKWILSLFLLALGSSLAGHPIEPSTARQVAQHFLHSLSSNRGAPIEPILIDTDVAGVGGKEGFFYVFASGSGFVVVSGDDSVFPVLGYSLESSFDPTSLPQNVAKWLEGYRSQIRYAVENRLEATMEIQEAWNTILKATDGVIAPREANSVNPLLKTKWDQSPYENALCPYDSDYKERAVTGCVATAMAQVMKYWNYPATGTGFHSYNHDKYGTLSANFGNTNYQWSSMPNVISSPNQAVATLMYHCGVSVDMNYNVGSEGGSGASTLDVADALVDYFGYASTVTKNYRSDFSDAQWKTLLKTELDAGRPIQYAGTGTGGGHSFVCDGYDNNDFFHFNWGWGGNSDGYFLIDALNPGSLGSGGGTGGFNTNQRSITGIKPPAGTQTYSLKLYEKVVPSPVSLSYGDPFTVHTNIWNDGTGPFAGDYCAAIFDQEWNFVDFVEIKSGWTLNAGNIYTNGVTFSSEGLFSMLPGNYYVGIYYRPTGGNWAYIADNGNYKNFVEMSVYYYNDIELNSTIMVSPDPDQLVQGQPVSVHVNIRNDGNSTFYGLISADLYALDGSWVAEIGSLTESNGLPSGYTYIAPYLNFSTSFLNVSPGTYLLAIQYKPDGGDWTLAGSYYFQNPIFVTVQAPRMDADPYEENNTVAQSYTLPLNFTGFAATKTTQGSNCHHGTDYDYYRINLTAGYDYTIQARLHDSYNSGNGNSYTLDALFSWSTDGVIWSDAYDDVMPYSILSSGAGPVYFFVSPYFTGEIGNYLLELKMVRTAASATQDPEMAEPIVAFPNPARNYITIDWANLVGQPESIGLYQASGHKVLDAGKPDGPGRITLPLTNVPEGSYMLRIESGKNIYVQKIEVIK